MIITILIGLPQVQDAQAAAILAISPMADDADAMPFAGARPAGMLQRSNAGGTCNKH